MAGAGRAATPQILNFFVSIKRANLYFVVDIGAGLREIRVVVGAVKVLSQAFFDGRIVVPDDVLTRATPIRLRCPSTGLL